jgi:sec-independent protein translocase protein TatA
MIGFGAPSGGEFLLLMIVALLLFGRKLPEVARNIGKGMREFQSGLRGLENEVNKATYSGSSSSYKSSTSESSTARPIPEEEDEDDDDFDVPKFEPPTSAPVAADTESGSEPKTEDV